MIKYTELITQGTMGYVSLSYEQTSGTTAPALALDDYIPLTFNTERAENLDGYSLSGSQQITLPRGTYIAYINLGSYSTGHFSGGLAIAVETGDPDAPLIYTNNALEEGFSSSGSQTFHSEHFVLDEESVLEMYMATKESGTMTRNVAYGSLPEIRYTLTIIKVK